MLDETAEYIQSMNNSDDISKRTQGCYMAGKLEGASKLLKILNN